MINKTTSKALNIKMPDALLKQAEIVE